MQLSPNRTPTHVVTERCCKKQVIFTHEHFSENFHSTNFVHLGLHRHAHIMAEQDYFHGFYWACSVNRSAFLFLGVQFGGKIAWLPCGTFVLLNKINSHNYN